MRYRLSNFWQRITKNKRIAMLLLIFICIWLIVWDAIPVFKSGIEMILAYMILIFILLSGFMVLFVTYSNVIDAYKCNLGFRKMGLINHAGETPELIDIKKDAYRVEYAFSSNGIPLSKWQDKIESIENVLDISISSISTGARTNIIIVKGGIGKMDMQSSIHWRNNDIIANNELVLGMSMGYLVSINIEAIPHVLIGGATGSGKTYLLKHLLYQSISKGYTVIIADFKGGVDYPQHWKNKCIFLTDINNTIRELKKINDEMDIRKENLAKEGIRNIDIYNNKKNTQYKHVVFACDELAELLDTSGLDKEEKSKRQEVVKFLSSIARLGRAFGIHLFLATQRPDAEVVTGQIKNNISYRICGRADDVLSRIILDNTDAADRIPFDAQGVFVNNEGVIFKGFVFDDNR